MMKKTMMFLVMMVVMVWSKGQIYHVGDLYTAPNGSQGIVFYVRPDGGGWAVALNDIAGIRVWGDNYLDVPEIQNLGYDPTAWSNYHFPLQALADTAGYGNTMAILNSPQTITQTAAHSVDFSNGWYLPSIGQLCMIYAQKPFIENPLIDAGGSMLNEDLYSTYWSSSELNESSAWTVNFSAPNPASGFVYSHSGEVIPEGKHTHHHVRAVYSFPPPGNYYDTNLTYVWNTGATEPHFQDAPLQNTSYSVTATNTYGCTNSAEGAIIVLYNEPQILYDTICQGAAYNHYGFTLSAEETADSAEIVLSRIVSAGACESEITLFLTVRPHDTVYLEQSAVQFFVWNGVTYQESGIYTQHFNNQHGCDSIVILTLTINDSVNPNPDTTVIVESDSLVIYLPNTFTPSSIDGRNDCFYLPEAYHSLISDFEIRVFNRWGEQIFYSTDKNFRWYGEYKGKTFYDTVYNYLIRYHDSRGKPYLLRGIITVL